MMVLKNRTFQNKIILVMILLFFVGCSINKSQINRKKYSLGDLIYLINAISSSGVIFTRELYIVPTKINDKYNYTLYKIDNPLYSPKKLILQHLIENGEYNKNKRGIMIYYNIRKNIKYIKKINLIRIKPNQKDIIFIENKLKIPIPIEILWKIEKPFFPKKGQSKKQIVYFTYSELGLYIRKIQVYSKRKEKLIMKLIT